MTPVPRRYTASWVLPFEGPPIPRGAVLLDDAGRIAQVGPDPEVPAPPGVKRQDLEPHSALLPGFINTHTHLELTGFNDVAPEAEFPDWIRRIITLKSGRSARDFLSAARQGIHDGWAQGITTVADTGDSGAVLAALVELGGSGICYHEVFGPHPDQAEQQFRAWAGRMGELGAQAEGRVRLGASPHAPYSVSGELYRRVAAFAADRGLPMAVHLAESEAESRLLDRGEGGFARAWRARAIPLPVGGRSPVRWLDEHGVLGPATLCIHVVRADSQDLDLLASRRAAVAHCPRSNRRHGHGSAPLRGMLDRGLRVGVGTDSVASLGPLDLLAEARAARELGVLSAEAALALVTISAARALGLDGEIGSLAPGKWGDLAVVDLGGPVDAARLADTVLSLGGTAVRRTVVGGREVFIGNRESVSGER
jgi:cytosine/adenosine deaminase-related metal-dependent hydrolase